MNGGSSIGFGLAGIGQVLDSRLLAVPVYQRSYAWDADQLDDFCTDLKNAFHSDPDEYFMGTIVLSREGSEGRDTVIDGQQRLATTCLLMAAIRDYFCNHDEDDRRRHIHSTYIGSYDDEADEYISRLVLNSEDDAFFRERVVNGDEAAEAGRDSEKLIDAAYDRLAEFVEEQAASVGPKSAVKHLTAWRHFVHDRVRVIWVEVPTESDAFLIFETLNDRGADLTLADLLKNFLFGKVKPSKLTEVRDSWLLALSAFDMDAEIFVTFIRHYWSSVHGPTRERDLYSAIKNGVTNHSQALKFAKDLETASRLYAALLNSEHEYWVGWGTSTNNNVDTLRLLALEQNRPMLLAAMQHFTKAEMKKTLRSSVSWSVRGLIVGGIGGGTTEKAYADAAVKIRSGRLKSTAKLKSELTRIIPSDEAFTEAFSSAKVTKSALARYYLNALERKKANRKEPELVPNANEEEVNLEHVLPKKASTKDWPSFSTDEITDCIYRIGNLALLKKTENAQIGNQPFSVKQPILKKSALVLTSGIGKKSTWTKKAIQARQDRLAELAVKMWK